MNVLRLSSNLLGPNKNSVGVPKADRGMGDEHGSSAFFSRQNRGKTGCLLHGFFSISVYLQSQFRNFQVLSKNSRNGSRKELSTTPSLYKTIIETTPIHTHLRLYHYIYAYVIVINKYAYYYSSVAVTCIVIFTE